MNDVIIKSDQIFNSNSNTFGIKINNLIDSVTCTYIYVHLP